LVVIDLLKELQKLKQFYHIIRMLFIFSWSSRLVLTTKEWIKAGQLVWSLQCNLWVSW